MSAFGKDYYFILRPEIDGLPSLTPDEDTNEKPYTYKALPIGGKPLIFYNGGLDWQREHGVTPMDTPPNIIFCGSNFVVCNEIADKLWDLEIPNLVIQPAIYIDHRKKWHENYWFLTFTAKFDCWDKVNSVYHPEPMPDTDPPIYGVSTYSLNEQLLKDTPLPERLLFKMGGTTDGFIVVHQSFMKLFQVEGVELVLVEEW